MLTDLATCKTLIARNPLAARGSGHVLPPKIFSADQLAAVLDEISSWPGYAPTPLVPLSGLAQELGLCQIWYKDEGDRFGLGSFKALGGAYAVFRLLQKEIERRNGARNISFADLSTGRFTEMASEITVACATDGNHGRSVSWGAKLFGCNCVIFLHEGVSAAREAAITEQGARTVRIPGNYDDSVLAAAEQALDNGWFVISDTSYEGYTNIPGQVMQGYSVLVSEALAQLPAGERPTHIAIQGGVGGLAAAVFSQLIFSSEGDCPRFVVVEPETAACLYESALAGRAIRLDGSLETIMAGLSCGEPSLLAWEILATCVDDYVVIPDQAAAIVMRLLAAGCNGDPVIVAGESGAAGLAGIAAAVATDQGGKLALDGNSRLLVVGTESDTDPEAYARIVGKAGDQVRAGN